MIYKELEKQSSNIIEMYGRITTDIFYSIFMKNLNTYINSTIKKKKAPIISIENVTWIDSSVLPCLLITGIALRKYYGQPIILEMSYNPQLLQYLYVSRFFFWAKKLDIYSYNEEFIGGFQIEYNTQYKIEKFPYYSSYYELDESHKIDMKYMLQDRLERYDVAGIFGQVISKVIKKDCQEYDFCITAISEVISNSMLYSLSDSYVCIQALSTGVFISISDSGIGITESLKRKNIQLSVKNEAKEYSHLEFFDSPIFEDFWALFMALQESEENERVNLWKLKNIIVNNDGCMKIHTNRIQIIFSSKLCARCEKNSATSCMKCMLNNFSTDYQQSPLRIYDSKIVGVHIEIEFLRGRRK